MLRLAVSLTALVVATSFALAPVERQTAEYTWQPEDDGHRVPLLLIERTPDRFQLSIPCRLLEGGERSLFASSRVPDEIPTLTVRSMDSRTVIEVPELGHGPDGPRRSLFVAAEDCDVVQVAYDRRAGQMTVTVDDAVDGVLSDIGDAFEMTGLHWLGIDARGVHATVLTSPASMVRNSAFQKALLVMLGLLALVAAVLVQVAGYRWHPRPGSWRPHASDFLMLFVAMAVALVDLPRVDDGRILSRARLLAGYDLSANVDIMVENQILPQRWFYEWLLGSTAGSSDLIIVMRSLSILMAVLAWVLLRRGILPVLAGGHPAAGVLTTAWAVHAVFVVAWFATLRPEPLVVFLTIAVLAILGRWPGRPTAWPYAGLGICIGLAAATHLAGLAVLFAALPVLWRLTSEIKESWVPVVTGIAWGGSLGIVALFVGSNLAHTFAAASEFQEGIHGYGVLDVMMYVNTIQNSTAPMMLSAGLVLLAGAGLIVAFVRRFERGVTWRVDAVMFGAALSPLGLLFTTSKWIWHLAVLAPVAVIGWTLIAIGTDRLHGKSMALAALVSAPLGVLLAWSLRPAWHPRMAHRQWRDVTLRNVHPDVWGARLPWLIGQDVRWWLWVLLLLGVAILSVWMLRGRAGMTGLGAVSAPLLVCLGVVAVVQVAPPVADAVVSGSDWTFVRQSVVGITSREVRCGVPAATPVLDGHVQSFAVGQEGGPPIRMAGHSMAFMFAPCTRPMAQQHGVWVVPETVMGPPVQGQRRMLTEYDMSEIGCHEFPRDRHSRLCFSSLTAEGGPLNPTRITWSTHGN